MINIENLKPFPKFCYTIGMIPSSYKENLTYEEQLLWLCDYLENTVIPTVNNNGMAVEELQNLLVQLKDYVDNYFENLDVQEEIDKKLDEMAQDGSLGQALGIYITPIIDEQNSVIQNIQNSLNSEMNTYQEHVNEQLSIIDNKVNSSLSGSPAGVYATVSDLETADPDHDKIYVVTANGKWYYYDTGESAWTEGGTYQTSGVANNSITIKNLKTNLQTNIIPLNCIAGAVTQTGTIFNGNVGSTANQVSAGHTSTGTLSVTEGDIVYIPFANGYTTEYPTIPLLLICDDEDTILAKYTLSDFLNEIDSVKRPVSSFIQMPADAYLLRFNNYTYDFSTENSSITIPYKITSYNYNDDRLKNVYNGYETISPAEVISGKMYSLRAWNLTLASYNTLVYNVNPQEIVHLEHTLATANYLCNAMFSDNDGNITGFLAPYGDNSDTVSINGDYVVPPLSTKMYISQPKTYTSPVVKRKVVLKNNTKNVTASINDGVLSLSSDIQTIIMQHFGGNELFMIKSYTNKEATTTITTDLIPAPYIVNAVSNANGDRVNEGFTGGNHQWNNQASGSTPTAEEISLVFYADDTVFESGTVNCSQFKIVETNRVQANNTCLEAGSGRNVLEEKITYIFDGYTLKITNEITPLEDIIIKRYYGVQLAGSLSYNFYSDIIYTQANFQSVPTTPLKIVGNSGISAHLIKEGLGTLDYNFNSNNYKVNYGTNKAYYWLIDNNTNTFTTSDKLYFTCEYVFNEIT